MGQNASPRAQNGLKNLFEHPKWSRNMFGKNEFFAPETLVDPPLAPTVHGPSCPPAPPSGHYSARRARAGHLF